MRWRHVVVDSTFILELMTHRGERGRWCRRTAERFIRNNTETISPIGTAEDALHMLRIRAFGGAAIPGTDPRLGVEHVDQATYFLMALRIGTMPMAHPRDLREFLPRTTALAIEHPHLSINGLLACAMAEQMQTALYTCNETLVMNVQAGMNPPQVEFRSPAGDVTQGGINRARRGGTPER